MSAPSALLENQVDVLLERLPRVRDAAADAVHDARVATRRIREALALFAPAHPDEVERLRLILRRAGRLIGRVRELDIVESDLERYGTRVPLAGDVIETARRTLVRQRARARRRMIRGLDVLELDRRQRYDVNSWQVSRWQHVVQSGVETWDEVLRRRIGKRAGALALAIERASGVYFPNRTHDVRIAAKKLRYSVELARLSGLWRPAHMVGDLKQAQDTLGSLHDLQVLLDTLDDLSDDQDVKPSHRRMVKDLIESDMAERHAEYMAQRDRLRTICGVCRKLSHPPARRRVLPLMTAAVFAVETGVLLLRTRERSTGAVREPNFA